MHQPCIHAVTSSKYSYAKSYYCDWRAALKVFRSLLEPGIDSQTNRRVHGAACAQIMNSHTCPSGSGVLSLCDPSLRCRVASFLPSWLRLPLFKPHVTIRPLTCSQRQRWTDKKMIKGRVGRGWRRVRTGGGDGWESGGRWAGRGRMGCLLYLCTGLRALPFMAELME